jgi:hypothetical protein
MRFSGERQADAMTQPDILTVDVLHDMLTVVNVIPEGKSIRPVDYAGEA